MTFRAPNSIPIVSDVKHLRWTRAGGCGFRFLCKVASAIFRSPVHMYWHPVRPSRPKISTEYREVLLNVHRPMEPVAIKDEADG